MEKYAIELDRHQMLTIQLACEAFSRLCTGQIHIALEVAWPNKILDLDPDKKDEINYHMRAITKILSDDKVDGWAGSYGIGSPEINPKAMTSYNILQVIRNHFWKERSKEDRLQHYGVDSSVCITNGEDPIKIEKIEDTELLKAEESLG